jgi:hypothetical protein
VQQDIQSLLQLQFVLDIQVLNLERKINVMILNRKSMEEDSERSDEDLTLFFQKIHPLGAQQEVIVIWVFYLVGWLFTHGCRTMSNLPR